MWKHLARAVIVTLGLSLSLTTSILAREYQCTVLDPTGDPTLSPGRGFDGEAYQDIVKTGITRTPGAVVFAMELAAPIPKAPHLRTPNGLLLWMWGMNTSPGTQPGYPLSPGVSGLLEFWIHLAWNGANFYAEVIDRRPALNGGAPVVTPVTYLVEGSIVKVIAPPSLFDDPQEFRWGSSTWIWPTHLGTTSPHVVDRVPDGPASTCIAN